MFEPMVVILAWPVVVFADVLFDLHRNRQPAEEATPAPVAVAQEPVAAPAWQSSISAPA